MVIVVGIITKQKNGYSFLIEGAATNFLGIEFFQDRLKEFVLRSEYFFTVPVHNGIGSTQKWPITNFEIKINE